MPEKPDGIQEKGDINGRSDGGSGVREGDQENEGGTGRRSNGGAEPERHYDGTVAPPKGEVGRIRITSTVEFMISIRHKNGTFSGQRVESNSYRHYSSRTGRWPNRDPFGEKAFETVTSRRDSHISKWLNRDSIAEAGHNNVYLFCNNRTEDLYDFNGPFYVGGGLVAGMMEACTDVTGYLCSKQQGLKAGYGLNRAGVDTNDEKKGGNAMTHCYAACLLAKKCGNRGMNAWNNREPKPYGASDIRDLANDAGEFSQSSNSDCFKACLDAWKGGKLICGTGKCGPPANEYAD